MAPRGAPSTQAISPMAGIPSGTATGASAASATASAARTARGCAGAFDPATTAQRAPKRVRPAARRARSGGRARRRARLGRIECVTAAPRPRLAGPALPLPARSATSASRSASGLGSISSPDAGSRRTGASRRRQPQAVPATGSARALQRRAPAPIPPACPRRNIREAEAAAAARRPPGPRPRASFSSTSPASARIDVQRLRDDRAGAVWPAARNEIDQLPPAHRRVVAVARRLVQHGQQTIVEPHSCPIPPDAPGDGSMRRVRRAKRALNHPETGQWTSSRPKKGASKAGALQLSAGQACALHVDQPEFGDRPACDPPTAFNAAVAPALSPARASASPRRRLARFAIDAAC